MKKVALFTGIAEHKAFFLDEQLKNYAELEDFAEIWYYVNNSSPEFVKEIMEKCRDYGFKCRNMGMINPGLHMTSNSNPFAKCLNSFYHYCRSNKFDYVVINGGDNTLQPDYLKLLHHFDDPKVGLVSGLCYIRLAGEIHPHTVACLGANKFAISKEGRDKALELFFTEERFRSKLAKVLAEDVWSWGEKYATVPMMSFTVDELISNNRINKEVMNGSNKTIFDDCIVIPSPGLIIPKRFFVMRNFSSQFFSMDIYLERKVMDLGYKLLLDSSVLTGHWMENMEEVR